MLHSCNASCVQASGKSTTDDSMLKGIIACVVYTLLTAASSVLAKPMLKRARLQQAGSLDEHERHRICVAELSFVYSAVPAAVAIPEVAVAGVLPNWKRTFRRVKQDGNTTAVAAIALALALAKMVDRSSKVELIKLRSPFSTKC